VVSPERVASLEPRDDDVLKQGIQGVFDSFECSMHLICVLSEN
jgi:hypothetical protein